jgi:glyoxylase-like metal-dependent hydrolase (beta-lactamase superfamily II)
MISLDLPERDIKGIRAPNLSPVNVSGSNSWIVGRDPAWLVDPGPELDEHVHALVIEIVRRGGLGGVALTHDHWDHSAALPGLRSAFPGVPLAAARGEVDVHLLDGGRFGPLRAVVTPGHAPDHLAFVAGDVALTGDAVLGEGSVFVAPYPGAMAGYIDGLLRLRALAPAFICPGHGPLVRDADAKLAGYIAHRLARERQLLAALDAGLRTVDELLDAVWAGTPEPLRLAATATLAAHLDKLADEGRLPAGVQRPPFNGWPP